MPSVVCALIPAALVWRNLRLYRPLPPALGSVASRVSVLIPARNEEGHIGDAVASVLETGYPNLEVCVWDDASEDRTGEIVESLCARDSRVRLLRGAGVPSGWAGKPHACMRLAEAATGEILVFMDADVRLKGPGTLERLVSAFERTRVDLWSGVPRQRMHSLWEWLIIPQIHFVLLGFLPIDGMRAGTDVRFAAGCGQLMAFRRESYFRMGGHGAARASFHEGIQLSRAVRRSGGITDLFDATDFAICRMYAGGGAVWRGFAKNAHEGLGAPGVLVPMSALLLLGQVLPAWVLACGWGTSLAQWLSFFALGLGLASRYGIARRFAQPAITVWLHPVGVMALLLNQWYGVLRHRLGSPVGWRGRTLPVILACLLLVGWERAGAQEPVVPAKSAETRCPDLCLEDQFRVLREIRFPRKKPVLLVTARRSGTPLIADWVEPVQRAFEGRLEIYGVAAVEGVPDPIKPVVRSMIGRSVSWPVLMDWTGNLTRHLLKPGSELEVVLVRPEGQIALVLSGRSTPEAATALASGIQALLAKRSSPGN
ncbi:MAG: 4,4-diaponeurosporenoate glycosyltransferase [Verrucomicrobiota bacterium]|jgi:hypothetical protein